MDSILKTCSKCKLCKLKSEFNKMTSSLDGYQNQCRLCNNTARREFEYRAEDRRRYATPEGRQQARCRNTVRRALKRGTLEKPDHCQFCYQRTAADSLQAHHDDYNKPLEVKWACIPKGCHSKLDKLRRLLERLRSHTSAAVGRQSHCATPAA